MEQLHRVKKAKAHRRKSRGLPDDGRMPHDVQSQEHNPTRSRLFRPASELLQVPLVQRPAPVERALNSSSSQPCTQRSGIEAEAWQAG